MPGVYVVPGGRVEPEDGDASGFKEVLRPLPQGLDQATRKAALATVRAALRETFEETGLLYGTPHQAPAVSQHSNSEEGTGWSHYTDAALRPAFDHLLFIARAITPTFSPRRFHTRFLLGDGGFAEGQIAGDGELEDIGWHRLEAIAELPMAGITRLVLKESLKHYDSLRKTDFVAPKRPAAMFRWTGSQHRGGVSASPTTLQA
ncbi:hypothetical protein [Pelagibius sp. Alg239-R121]|uniref:hypothetical protein n=1 Tax=Pelagibius sp. Alg239-R121 TaxID=2993448 RepID=UPI0034605D2D